MRIILSFILILLTGMLINLSSAGALEWHQEKDFRWAELPVPREGRPGFTLLSPEQTGITFTNPLDERALAANRALANGCGAAMGDVDHDGLDDIFFCSLDGHNALYKNLGGMKFKDVTAGSGIVCTNRICRGAVFADINGDGWLDLLISTTGNGVLCFTNKGDGTFAECSQAAGTLSPYGATTLALADIDGNGTLDLYVANYGIEYANDRTGFELGDILQKVNGRTTVIPSMQDYFVFTNGGLQAYGEPDLVYLNDGKGHFTPLSWTNGAFLDEDGNPLTGPPRDWGLTAAFHDLNGDGAPDIYVCNDYWTPDRLWINDGRGHFRAAPGPALRHTSGSAMGVDFADVDRDGQVDFFVVDMLAWDWEHRKRENMLLDSRQPIGAIGNRPQIPQNTLFHNRGDGTFEEIGEYAGITASGWSWQPVFLDVDLDGYEDIIISAGYFHDMLDMDGSEKVARLRRAGTLVPPKLGPDGQPVPRSAQEQKTEEILQKNMLREPLNTPVIAFRNQGNLKFEAIGPTWGLDQPAPHGGVAVGDLDNDGGLDFVVNNLGSAASVYRNHGSAPRVAVRVKGLPPNTQGIGAKIKLLGGAVPTQSQEVVCGGLYQSGSDPERVFAAGKSGSMTIEVTWRNGRQSVVREAKPNRIYEIDEAGAVPGQAKPPVEEVKPFFKDVSQMIANRHHQEYYDDYVRQPLLPWQLSQMDPGVAWINLFGDQREELVVGSGRGGGLGIYAPDGSGGLTNLPIASRLAEDMAGIVGWVRGANQRVMVFGRDNYESTGNNPSAAAFGFVPTPWKQNLPETKASTGPLAVADIYGDGKLDLFVGGRVIPGRYPEAADSRIYRNVDGQLVLDEENSRVLEKVGLVNGAVWSDLDADGYPELILACEWGPIRVFKNQAGQLHEITKELGLARYTGWWRGVTTGDIDGDGRLDIIASNWGENSGYQASSNQPLRFYYGDFTDRGELSLIEGVYDPLRGAEVPRRMRFALANVYPPLLGQYPTHKAYAEATMEQILGMLPKPAEKVEAQTLDSMVFFNRTNHFEGMTLPYEAQVAPGFSVNVGDFDGDGNEDVFMSQNFSELADSTVSMSRPGEDAGRRLDAGRGLWLRGTGGGKFEAVPGQKSGILVYGEQRGAALGDFDGDGRVDLVVCQNGAETKLYQNVLGKPGLRVRLNGPPGNPDGVGATLRLVFGGRMGAAREIHGGSGYWSQDSVVQVMGCPTVPTQIWVRWPGGKSTTSAIPPGAREITVDTDGKLTVNH